jgi:hypothetical protein
MDPRSAFRKKKKKRRPATTDGGGWPVEAYELRRSGRGVGMLLVEAMLFFKKNRVLMSTDGILALVTLFSRTC